MAFVSDPDPSPDQRLLEKKVFLQFCTQMVFSWMRLPNFFVLLTGRADSLDLIENRHAIDTSPSPQILRRIGLNMIGRLYIPDIRKGTYRWANDVLTRLGDFYGVNPNIEQISDEENKEIQREQEDSLSWLAQMDIRG